MREPYETKALILNTALALCGKGRALSEIAIDELCSDAGISRATFYRHFSSKADLPAFFTQMAATVGYYQIGRTLTCRQGHERSLTLIVRAQPLVRHLRKPWEPDFSLSRIRKDSEEMKKTLKMYGKVMEAQDDYRIHMLAFAIYEGMSQWLQNDMDMPLDQLLDTICEFYPRSYRDAFDSHASQPGKTSVFNAESTREALYAELILSGIELH